MNEDYDHYVPVDDGSDSAEDGHDENSVENKEVSTIVTAAAAASISLNRRKMKPRM